MTAMGIIGIIMVSVVSLCLLMGAAAALLEERFKLKSELYARVCEDAAEAFAKQNRELFRNIMNDATEAIPSMAKAYTKAFEKDEEP